MGVKEEPKAEVVMKKESEGKIALKKEPHVDVKEGSEAAVKTNDEPCEQIGTKPQERFQELKTKLEDTLSKRAKLNNTIEEIMKKKFTEAKELAEKRLHSRLAREETVKEIQRRLEERKEAEKEKELSIKEKQLKTTLDSLRKEV